MDTIQRTAAPVLPAEEMMLVSRSEVEQWLQLIKQGNEFKASCEKDIGAVAEQMYKFKNVDIDITKLLRKAMMGNLDLKKELGLDLEALDAIVKKYAPETAARLAAQTQK